MARAPRLLLAAACAAAALAQVLACQSKVDPDKGRFSCAADQDCGQGWECIAQFKGGGHCYQAGACSAAEVCDGLDQNCDGRVDETFPESGGPCQTGLLGVCSAGATSCADGGLVCPPARDAGPELCNLLDDDCDGTVDEGFDLATDPANCGACTRACASGAGCRGGGCFEVACADGLDNDQDGGADCADPACLGAACSADSLYNCGGRDADGGTDGGTDGGATDAGSSDAGAPDAGELDGGAPDGGADAGTLIFCVPREGTCGDGADDDLDGLADCADPDCDGKTCATGTTCAARLCPAAG